MRSFERIKMENRSIIDTESGRENGYTLVEVLITMVVMSMILLVINMVLVSMIRVSYNTDIRLKMRQQSDFSLEVMRRTVKSTDPGNLMKVEKYDQEAIQMKLPGSGQEVLFYRGEYAMDDDTVHGVLKANWSDDGGFREVFLTSPYDMDVKLFEVDINDSAIAGSTEVLIKITADSANKRNSTEPLIKDQVVQTTILTRYKVLQ